ncbi:hypothetical protein [Roseivirga misakiensis]|uniref:Porin n=1 Tax=Roseivirga misakiensis TaxID=1563681 RepID=A0A1E5T718_9BACT|nr:hypothetical protein [Roseivirga misakiensis]OEK07169.1 hypothetical protein BFP71_05800 [Roseivirga misakiensis]
MKRTNFLVLIVLLLLGSKTIYAQLDNSYKPLTLHLDESGQKYIRFISWHQIWLENQNLSSQSDQGATFRVRRSRFLAYAQISPRFLIVTHFGLNSLTGANMDPIGDGRASDAPQLFLHGAWNEFRVTKDEKLYIGAGLHYWNGLSRLTSGSTLNFMTLDNYRQAWAQLGLSDQFARHLGVYAKGRLGKLRYTLALNNPISNALSSNDLNQLAEGSITYSGRRVLGKDAGTVFTGYFDYQFKDQESNKLPYRVGSYLGKKTVLNIGAGFFSHANGTVLIENGAPLGQDVQHFSADVFYDAPVSAGSGAINFYGAFHQFDYGDNYALGTTYGTGSSIYGQVGYVLPFEFAEGQRLMPYLAYSSRDFEAFAESGNRLQIGANWFINGHNAKISVEYISTLSNYTGAKPDRVNGLVFQTHIFL